MGILMYFVGIMATSRYMYEKRTIFQTLRLHKYNKVNAYSCVPKHMTILRA